MRMILSIPVIAPLQEMKSISREERKSISDFRAPNILKIPSSSLLSFVNRIETVASRNTLTNSTE
jgi:hypothetical protein